MSYDTSHIPKELKSFRNFLWLVWRHVNLPSPTEVQYDIALTLETGPRRLFISGFRGVGKSWITSAYVLWKLLWNPQLKFLIVSASKERADAFSVFTKRLINEIEVLAPLRARNGQRDSNIAFDVGPALAAHAPSVKSVGINGQITGSRADEIIADDIETSKNSLTQIMRDHLSEAIKEFEAIILPKPTSRVLFLGTPQTEESLYLDLPERGYTIRYWPARVPLADKMPLYQGRLGPLIQSMVDRGVDELTPTDPERFTDQELREREASYGRSGFSLQFMLDTSLSDQERYPLKLSDLIVMDVDRDRAPIKLSYSSAPEQVVTGLPTVGLKGDRYHSPIFIAKEWTKYTGSVMYIDPSGRGQDETGVAVVKHLNGMLFVTRCFGLQNGYSPESLAAIVAVAKAEGVNLVLIESNFGDGMYTELIKPILNRVHPCEVDERRATGQKELRIIETLEPVMNQHRLVFDKQVILDDYKTDDPKRQLFYQLTRITKDRNSLRHDDRIDALEGAVKYWTEQMAQDHDKMADLRKAELLQAALKRLAFNQITNIHNQGGSGGYLDSEFMEEDGMYML